MRCVVPHHCTLFRSLFFASAWDVVPVKVRNFCFVYYEQYDRSKYRSWDQTMVGGRVGGVMER